MKTAATHADLSLLNYAMARLDPIAFIRHCFSQPQTDIPGAAAAGFPVQRAAHALPRQPAALHAQLVEQLRQPQGASTPPTKAQIKEQIRQWVEAGPSDIEAKYAYRRAGMKIECCWRTPQTTVLELGSNYALLETLPPLPFHLTELKLESCRKLAALPDLSNLANLQRLSCVDCEALSAAPNLHRCTSLEVLELRACTALAASPNVEGCTHLRKLDLSMCINLTAPPDVRDCIELERLDLSCCDRLTAPPILLVHPQLQRLNLAATPLRSLPENILALPTACRITINATSLPDGVRNRLATMMNVPQYQGVRFAFDMAESARQPVLPLQREASSWREEGKTDHDIAQAVAAIDWSMFANEPGASSFSSFLGRLRETSEYRNLTLRQDFQRRVNALLDQLEQPSQAGQNTLRAVCFAQAHAGMQSCGDRVALTFLQFETLARNERADADVRQGKYDNNPADLAALGIRMHRMELVQQLACDKVKTLNFVDEIEVHLGYLVQLSREFDLPVQMQTMLYPRCSNLDEQDLEHARAQLHGSRQGARDEQALRFLSQWEPMVSLLDRVRSRQGTESGNTIPTSDDVGKEVLALQETIYKELSELDVMAADYKARANALQTRFKAVDGDASVALRGRHIQALSNAKSILCST